MSVLISRDHKVAVFGSEGVKVGVKDVCDIMGIPETMLEVHSDAMNCIIFSHSSALAGTNDIASTYYGSRIFGNALFVTGQELKSDKKTLKWINEQNSIYNQEEFNSMFMKTLRVTLETMNRRKESEFDLSLLDDKKVAYLDLDDIYYRLEQSEEAETDDDVAMSLKKANKPTISREEYDSVIRRSYEAIAKAEWIDTSDFTLFEGEESVVKLKPSKAKDTIEIMMQYFIDTEEYEKCAVLRDTILL